MPKVTYLFLKFIIKLRDVLCFKCEKFHHLNHLVIISMESKSIINSTFMYHKIHNEKVPRDL